MCGRFTLQIPPELIAEIFGLSEIPTYPTRYNIAPSHTAPIAVIRQDASAHNQFSLLQWGLIPSWADETYNSSHTTNARSETVQEKASFRSAIKYRRCIIPSSGFYEWQREGKKSSPYFIHMKDNAPMCFAGVWDHWKTPAGDTIESCSILTTSSNRLIASIHDRMPVILHPAEYNHWLDRTLHDPSQLTRFYQPYPHDLLEMYPVSPSVNNARNDSPDLILPLNH